MLNYKISNRSVLIISVVLLLLIAVSSQVQRAISSEPEPDADETTALSSTLFRDSPLASSLDTPEDDPTITRSRFVEVDMMLLGDMNSGRAPNQPMSVNDEIGLNLFDDANFEAVLDSFIPNDTGGYTWIGHLDHIPFSQVVMVMKDDVLVGNVSLPGGFYAIRYVLGSTHVIQELDHGEFGIEAEPDEVVYSAEELAAAADAPTADDGSTIDILIAYTTDARNGAGNTSAIVALIELAIAETNQSYANSGISQRMNLIHTVEVSYTESGNIATDRDRLRHTSDGYMDNVHSLRNTYAADMVGLIVENGGGYCGIAYIMTTVSAAFESSAFNVTARNCATGYYSFGHEFGHNMGARHDRYVDPTNNSPHTHNHAYVHVSGPWRTVMGYNSECSANGVSCTRLQYWSNPNVSYGGAPMGIADGSSQAADNRLTLNKTALTVANFRTSLSQPADGPFAVTSISLDDDTSNNSNGNNDGVANCGETIELYAQLTHQGSITAEGVEGIISTNDPYVTWTYNTDSSYGTINGGSSAFNANDFDFALDSGTPNGHIIQFDLDVTATNGGPWSDTFSITTSCAPASETGFTYQGSLEKNGSPINDTCSFQFKLYANETGGSQLSATSTATNITVNNGQFFAPIDFGAGVFNGDVRWLEISAKCSGDSSYTTLTPRQPITPAPHAIHAQFASNIPLAGSGNSSAAARSDHDHLDQTWTGTNSPLSIGGSYTLAPLVLNNTNGSGLLITQAGSSGVEITNANDGVYVSAAIFDGFQVDSAGNNGVEVNAAASYGVYVGRAEEDGVWVNTASDDGFYVSNAADDGVYIGTAGDEAIYVNNAGDKGLYIGTSGGDGIYVNDATTYGVVVNSAGEDGIWIVSASDDGVYVDNAADDGIVVDTAGDEGVYINSAGGDGVNINSAVFDGFEVGTTGDNGFEVNNATGNGLYVANATQDGVRVGSAGENGIEVNAAGANGVDVTASVNGVVARSTNSSGAGVWGINQAGGYGGFFEGRTHVNGTFSKSSGSFIIDHPLDPENQYLYHSFVESPDMMNIYNGMVDLDNAGNAVVTMPDWFEALNQEFRYQLTAIGGAMPNLHISAEISQNSFEIAGGEPLATVSWQVTGIRHDPYAVENRIPVEQDKPESERGTYLHPEAYGQPTSRGFVAYMNDKLTLETEPAAADIIEEPNNLDSQTPSTDQSPNDENQQQGDSLKR